jgi:hypothetical protein
MKNETLTLRAKISDKTLTGIFAQHKIDRTFWPEFCLLVRYGVRPGDELRRRLRNVNNYVAALNSILVELSKAIKHKFPPRGGNVPQCAA